jgi:hypothetical protein
MWRPIKQKPRSLKMFLARDNENRIVYEMKYLHYRISTKLEMFFRRIVFDGFSFGFPLGFNINFRLMSMSEYHNKYCPKIFECHRASKSEGMRFRNEPIR